MRDQVPRAALEHEAERIERATHDARPLAVARAQPPLLPGRGGDRGQMRHRVLGSEPAAGVEVEVALGAAPAPPPPRPGRGGPPPARGCGEAPRAQPPRPRPPPRERPPL